jgi:hypothetical protein
MTRTDDTGDGVGASVPVLKISSDPDAGFNPANGCGTEKGRGRTSSTRQRVVGLVILVVRNRFSYYNQRDTKLNWFQPGLPAQRPNFVVGSNLKIPCGKSCPTGPRLEPEMSGPKGGLRPCPDGRGQFVDCICYIKGTGYMPLSDYVKTKFTARPRAAFRSFPCSPS